jgi:hypothetical protein
LIKVKLMEKLVILVNRNGDWLMKN